MSVAENLKKVQEAVGKAKLVVITKTVEIKRIVEVQKLGVNCFGESYMQEAELKIPDLKAEWHFIGHLQSNKAKKAVELFDVIQTIDTPKLAAKLDRAARKRDKLQDIMVQVNISQEHERYGIKPEETLHFVQELLQLKNIRAVGLMAMAPFVAAEKTRPYFRQMKVIFDVVKKYVPSVKYLSMGMSNDYKQAVEEGSNMVRIGTALFG